MRPLDDTPGQRFMDGVGDSNPDDLSYHAARGLNRFNLAYLHVIEPRVWKHDDSPPARPNIFL
jgi:hypothetical protein